MRIAVTGVGVVSSLGLGAQHSFAALGRGERGIRPVTLFDTDGQRSRIAGQVLELDVQAVAAEGQVWSRSDAMAVLAAREAYAFGAPPPGASVAVAVGATTGGMYEAETILARGSDGITASARQLLSYPLSTTADRVADVAGSSSRRATLCSACSSGANAIVQGAAWIANGSVEHVLAGGTDGLCRLTFAGFNALQATDPAPCRPFDKNRAGMNLGEGAGFLLLESESAARRRGARVLAWLSGWAVGAEAFHITRPEPSGETAARLIERALSRAGLSSDDIDYINAHGTGTVPNDAMEAAAVQRAFGRAASRVLVSSSKGHIGHTLGAAGAIEAAFTVLAVEQGCAPPTAGLVEPDATFALRHVIGHGLPARLRAAISSSFGFGGTGAVLVFEHPEADPRNSARTLTMPLMVTATATLGPLGELTGTDAARYADPSVAEPASLEAPDVDRKLDPAKSRRFDRVSALITRGAERAVQDAGLGVERVGLVAGTAFGNVERSMEFVRLIEEKGARRAPPAEFPHLVPSAPAGNASVYLGLKGPVLSTCSLAASAEAAVHVGCDWVRLGVAPALVVGAAEALDEVVRHILGPLYSTALGGRRGEGGAWLVVESSDGVEARGARALAALEGYGTLPEATGLAGPKSVERALVVLGAEDAALRVWLEESAWRSVEKRQVAPRSGAHEAIGAFALAAAVALLARGEADEALVCGSTLGRGYFTHLRAAG